MNAPFDGAVLTRSNFFGSVSYRLIVYHQTVTLIGKKGGGNAIITLLKTFIFCLFIYLFFLFIYFIVILSCFFCCVLIAGMYRLFHDIEQFRSVYVLLAGDTLISSVNQKRGP